MHDRNPDKRCKFVHNVKREDGRYTQETDEEYEERTGFPLGELLHEKATRLQVPVDSLMKSLQRKPGNKKRHAK